MLTGTALFIKSKVAEQRMFSKLLNSDLLYIQIWESRVKITLRDSSIVFDEVASIVLTTNAKGEEIIGCVGNKVKSFASDNPFKVIKPFSHPRTLVPDFIYAEKLLQYAVKEATREKRLIASPLIVVHPMEKLEGCLTSVEKRVFQELALGAGARDVIVHEGDELILSDYNFEAAKEKPFKEATSSANKAVAFIVIIVFTLLIFSPIIYDLMTYPP